MHNQECDKIGLTLANTLSGGHKFQMSDEHQFEKSVMDLTEQLIALCGKPRHKFLRYLLGMVYLEMSELVETTEAASNSSFQTVAIDQKDGD